MDNIVETNCDGGGGGGGGGVGGGNNIGKHLIIDISQITNHKLLNSVELLYETFDKLCNKYDFNVLSRTHHLFEPHGITLLYLLAESHISFHSYPEHAACFIDIFTCRVYPDNSVYDEIYADILADFGVSFQESCSKMIIDRQVKSLGGGDGGDGGDDGDGDACICS